MQTILVTGSSGFIGSHFVNMLCDNKQYEIIAFCRNTDQKNLIRLRTDISIRKIYGDLTGDISDLLAGVDYVVNFAAKTFVDHSIRDAQPFINSNILGTYNLLEEARRNKIKRFIQISTDEVYGSIIKGAHTELSPLNPCNPYSASKAASDMLCLSYANTYGLPIIITRTENNYGEYQHRQKAIPTFVKSVLEGKPIRLYGDGMHSRMWLYVKDHCLAIMHLLEHGKVGEIYHVAGEQELTNLELAQRILKILGKKGDEIEFIDDSKVRPGHDRRYALNTDKIKATGWKAQYPLDTQLEKVVKWYADNKWWIT